MYCRENCHKVIFQCESCISISCSKEKEVKCKRKQIYLVTKSICNNHVPRLCTHISGYKSEKNHFMSCASHKISHQLWLINPEFLAIVCSSDTDRFLQKLAACLPASLSPNFHKWPRPLYYAVPDCKNLISKHLNLSLFQYQYNDIKNIGFTTKKRINNNN